jgi:F-type H+-transporting ATPase subunit beta
MAKKIGKILQVIGPVVDVSFEEYSENLPRIHEALEIEREGGEKLIVECQQHTGEHTIRTIAMDSTDGLQRGMEVIATGMQIKMPKGDTVKGRLLNVVGEAIDGIGEVDASQGYQVHNPPPIYENLSTETEVLLTGIKVIDLLEPYAKGGKIGLFGGAGVGKTVIIMETDQQHCQEIRGYFGICRRG